MNPPNRNSKGIFLSFIDLGNASIIRCCDPNIVRLAQRSSNGTKENVIAAAKIYYNPLGFLIEKISESTANSTDDGGSNKSLEELQLSASKQELQMQMGEHKQKSLNNLLSPKELSWLNK